MIFAVHQYGKYYASNITLLCCCYVKIMNKFMGGCYVS